MPSETDEKTFLPKLLSYFPFLADRIVCTYPPFVLWTATATTSELRAGCVWKSENPSYDS